MCDACVRASEVALVNEAWRRHKASPIHAGVAPPIAVHSGHVAVACLQYCSCFVVASRIYVCLLRPSIGM